MANITDPAIPKGSTVLVTGVNGFIASHVADQFVQHGYKVRGTVRNPEKSAWLNAYFDKTYGEGHFELYPVPDMTVENAYDEAVKGVSAFIHVASVVNFDPDPEKVIPIAVESAAIAIKAAYREPSVKRFVLTSSSSTTLPADPQTFLNMNGAVITEDSWSPDAKELAWTPGPWGPEHGGPVYIASKVEQEQTVWKYHKENQAKRPDLVVNAILPNLNLGKSLDPVNQGHPSTSGFILPLLEGKRLPPNWSTPQYAVDVQDAGLLHVAAAILPDVKSERVFGFAEPFCWDDVLEILRKQHPNKKFHENFAGVPYPDIVIKPRDRAEELLKRLGKPGWTSLADSLRLNTEDL
ncbi:Putative NAD-dependent epimerase/dehydratase, NAD(P)-binding domain superfamily [Colletotrichum destructivum]|uniref:NAD-dependent epimerase/dehydratase, NAD(P)-binding domain superfamily n=1 Tax=Colletotrichum destructivum TaxID=34406 RepID=A0AAX4INC8_9PEZI|nr:Putative NAD-dependent epimerase/dehydratase, NAD(P)-binding domain superfamily [Colletotrichum destructivum]